MPPKKDETKIVAKSKTLEKKRPSNQLGLASMQKNVGVPAYVRPVIKFNFELYYEAKEKIEAERSHTPKPKK